MLNCPIIEKTVQSDLRLGPTTICIPLAIQIQVKPCISLAFKEIYGRVMTLGGRAADCMPVPCMRFAPRTRPTL